MMSGNRARRRQTRFMHADYKLIEGRQPPLKDQDDERGAHDLLRLLVPVSPFVTTQSIRSDPSVSGGHRTKREHFLDRLRGFPVAPIFMIWSSD